MNCLQCGLEFTPGLNHISFCSEVCKRYAMAKEVVALHTPDTMTHTIEHQDDTDLLLKAADGRGLGSTKQKADQELIAREIIKWGALALRKNADYGSSVWDVPVLAPGMSSDEAIKVRMSDKLSRLKQLEGQEGAHIDESLDDTYRDLGIYCLLKIINPNRHSVAQKELDATASAIAEAINSDQPE